MKTILDLADAYRNATHRNEDEARGELELELQVQTRDCRMCTHFERGDSEKPTCNASDCVSGSHFSRGEFEPLWVKH